jgi:hypothetical protein
MEHITFWPVLCKNINTIKRNTKALLHVHREVHIEVSTEETKCVAIFRHHRAFENVATFKYQGTAVTFRNYIHKILR